VYREVHFHFRMTPMVRRLLVVHGVIWLVTLVAVRWLGLPGARTVASALYLHPAWADPDTVLHGRIWQLLTYMWMHDLRTPLHILFNLLMLWMFGTVLEQRWGGRPLLVFYVLCGVGGAIVTVLAALIAPGLFGAPVLGASGAVLGLIAAFARTFPNQNIYLWFALPLPARYLIPLTIAIDLLFFLTNPLGMAFATHMGGLGAGWLLVTGRWRPSRMQRWFGRIGLSRRRRIWVVGERGRDRWLH